MVEIPISCDSTECLIALFDSLNCYSVRVSSIGGTLTDLGESVSPAACSSAVGVVLQPVSIGLKMFLSEQEMIDFLAIKQSILDFNWWQLGIFAWLYPFAWFAQGLKRLFPR